MSQSSERNTKFLIFIDILGFDQLAREIAAQRGINERKIRQDFIQVVNEKIRAVEQRGEILGKSFSQRDDWLLVVSSLEEVFNTLYSILDHTTDYIGFNTIPLEIAVGTAEYDGWARLNGYHLVCENETIDFLKTQLINRYHKWYRAKFSQPITDSFIVLTESTFNKMTFSDKQLCKQVKDCDSQLFLVATEKIFERGKLLSFLTRIGKSRSSSIRQISWAFVPPNEYQNIVEALERKKVIFLVGDPAIGKTYTAARIMWEYYLKGYNPIWNSGAGDTERILSRQKLAEFNIENHSITYFEDPFGARGRFEDDQELTKTIISTVLRAQILDARVIISSREELFNSFKKSIISKHDLSQFIISLRLSKPSYTEDKLRQILHNWANEFQCSWLTSEGLKCYILSTASERLLTPFSLWDFAASSINIYESTQLIAMIEEKSKDIKLSFAEEIANMSTEKKVFLSLIAIFSSVDYSIVKSCYDKLSNHYSFKTSFEKCSKDFEIKVSREKLENEKAVYHFTHPLYEEAVISSWNNEEMTELVKETYHRLIMDDDPFVKGCCGLSLMKYYQEISFSDYAKDIIFRLLKNNKYETRLGIILGFEYSFKYLPISTSLEFADIMLRDKNSDIRARCLCIFTNNFSEIPVDQREKILANALDDRAAWVRFEAVRCIRANIDLIEPNLIQKALIVNEKLSTHGCRHTRYLSTFLRDDLFKTYEETRNRIENIENREMRFYLKAVYLLGLDGSQLSKTNVEDKKILEPKGITVSCAYIEDNNFQEEKPSGHSKIPAAIFKFSKSNRNLADDSLTYRTISLPLHPEYDPWVKELHDYFREKGANYVFPFNCKKVWDYITTNHTFAGLVYRIREYKYTPETCAPSMGGRVKISTCQPTLKMCDSHKRSVKLAALRRLRTYELIDKYSFDCSDLDIFFGKNESNSIQNEDWHRYIRKLCTQ